MTAGPSTPLAATGFSATALGIGRPDANGDTIYNGAQDNATGIAHLVEQARAFAKGPRPDRSIVFLAVTAEEKGLLGSTYYSRHPVVPWERTTNSKCN